MAASTRAEAPHTSRLPGVRALASYRAAWAPRDVVAGLVLATLLVPQGMAYAELAALPAITGLYTSILCLIGYALFGPSRLLVLGPDSSLGPMIAATILPLAGAGGDPVRAIALASTLALLVGALTVLGGVLRLGFVADLLSRPTMVGYMNGLALTILVGQLPKLFGFSVDAEGFVAEARGFLSGLADGQTVTAALAVGAFGLVTIGVLGRVLPRIPGVLAAVVLSIAAARAFDLDRHGVSLVGTLPQGFPPLTFPRVELSDLGLLFAGAVAIAIVALADTIATASAFAERTGQTFDADQEMIGIGAANVGAGLFQGFPVSTSGSRTAVAESAGARTQLAGVVGAGAIVLMLVLVPGLLRNLPQPTLAAVVIAASLTLADIPATMTLRRQRTTDFAIALVAFLGVVLLGVLAGIVVAIGLSIGDVFRRAWRPYQTELGSPDGVAGYHDLRSHPDAERLPGLAIVRFDAPLFFANARAFREQVLRCASAAERPDWIIVAAEPITDVDTTAAEMLADLDDGLESRGVRLVFAELNDPVRRTLRHYRSGRLLEPGRTFPTLDDAVSAFRAETGARRAKRTPSDVAREKFIPSG
jgi:high affinity sulfate transporter 1